MSPQQQASPATAAGHPEFILTLSCQDRPGVVYAVSSFLVQHHCTIISSQQYGDQETGLFFMRVRFSCFDGDELATLQRDFARISATFDMSFTLRGAQERQRVLLDGLQVRALPQRPALPVPDRRPPDRHRGGGLQPP